MAATLGRLLIAAAPSIAAGWALGAGFTTRSQQTASTGARVDLSMAEGGHFEYLVLGGGSGGIASARRAAAHGAKVGVIERARLGGTCVNVGCVPKKVMFNAGSMQQFFHQAAGYGFELGSVDFKWSALKSKRDAYVKRLNGIYERNLDNSGVEFIVGDAKFTGAKEVTVGDKTYTADTILIAVGGKPVLPDVPGIEHAIESDGFFELEELPGKVAVIGSGYIAVELAGILKLLGAEACRAVLSPQPHSWSCEPTPPLLIHTTIVADSGFSPGPSPRLAVLHPQRTSSLPSLLFHPSSSIPSLPSTGGSPDSRRSASQDHGLIRDRHARGGDERGRCQLRQGESAAYTRTHPRHPMQLSPRCPPPLFPRPIPMHRPPRCLHPSPSPRPTLFLGRGGIDQRS